MAKKVFPQSQVPVRKSVELLPEIFKTSANDKFMSAIVDPLVQPGVLEKTVGFIGRRFGKTYNGSDIYIDSNETLRSRYQLEPGVIFKKNNQISEFYDYLDFKNQLVFFGNTEDRDDKITEQVHYSWNPPIAWDKFVNYREYYWEPLGPPPVTVAGQSVGITSTYSVALGFGSSFIFTPDGLTNNPTITLYRGQTYKFKVNAPGEGFVIRTNYDTASLLFNPNFPYTQNQLVVFDGKLWRATRDLLADPNRVVSAGSGEWEMVTLVSDTTALDYNKGVTNNAVEVGILEFTVPFDAPDVLFYQGLIDPNRVGRFIVLDVQSNTRINIDREILGKQTYTSSNGVEFSNGLVVEFRGQVIPEKYSRDTWLVEGVGKGITLTRFNDLVAPVLTDQLTPEVLFDNTGFDSEPFDDASTFPGRKDYITIERDSRDLNPWSRYNRWFHRSVLEYAYKIRGQTFLEKERARAKRPIIEFIANLQLFDHGAVAKQTVDYIDDFTDDIFSKIEGSNSYNIDGEFVFDGARVLFTADTDRLANNKIYQIKFITHNNVRQITLVATSDSESNLGECVLVQRGNNNSGKMFFYDGSNWNVSQEKKRVNQQPQFDVFDQNEVSFADSETYPVSSFVGSEILSYKIGNGVVDKELGFSISYLNIDNVGDIQFQWSWELEKFDYTIDQQQLLEFVNTGFYKNTKTGEYLNGWIKTDNSFVQPINDSIIVQNETREVELSSVVWDNLDNNAKVTFYLNGEPLTSDYTRTNNTFVFDRSFRQRDIVSVRIIADLEPNKGYYEIPVGLEKNPLNNDLKTFTLGQAKDHLMTALEFDDRIIGSVPGPSNLRDIDGYQIHLKRFLKHAGIAPLAISLLCDKEFNIVKSIQYAKKSYTEFKNRFLDRAIEIEVGDNIADFVDSIINDITKSKTINSPFVDSDMIGSGAYTSLKYTVEDEGINTFALNEKFTLAETSNRAVYVYLNQQQLLHGKEYKFNDLFGFVNILVELTEGDQIEIREYVSTSFNYIPPTPTAIGLYKKYTPTKFVDDTYRDPQEVIQGHDGSITIAFGDYRDDLLLELEYRIYNNIKLEYDQGLLNIDEVFGGYYSNALYTKPQLDNIVNQEFLKWIQNTNINYTQNEFFKENETFTYTYSNMIDPGSTQNLPGWWRGVYQWFYDTDRPHRCPWEMLGFSEQPEWWTSEYGPAPYTSNNLILWEDLRDGVIRQGARAGRYSRYARPSIISHIPVDGDGILLSPLDSGLAKNFVLINNRGDFVLGDVSPVEYAWRSSSEWPFALMTALSLMKPFEFILDNFDRSRTRLNKIGQKINTETGIFLSAQDFKVPGVDDVRSVGLVQYLVAYIRSRGGDERNLKDRIQNIDVKLSSRLSGFVDKAQQKYLLDSKNPASASSSIFVPAENYDIIFNISAPIASVTYSGVVVEKTDRGWIINGYDSIEPYFEYYQATPNQQDPVVSIGGVSENFIDWEPNTTFNNGIIVRFKNEFFRSIRTHNSEQDFNPASWRRLAKIPLVGGVTAQRRRNFNRTRINKLSYGTILSSVQAVVDFLLGYEDFLKSRGFVFDNYDAINQVSQDWFTSAKEFMFWTKHNWVEGSLITLSPAAQKISVTVSVGVVDDLLDGFYDYQVLKADGKPLSPEFVDIRRDFENITIKTVDDVEGIYYLKMYYVLKEHVAVFDDKTVFNDIIYDKTSGYRQERIKTQGFRTTDWDGDYTSPGFLFDNVNIEVWQSFKDYRLGDIVSYRSLFWTSQENQVGTSTFDDSKWARTDSRLEKQLVANFDYKINQIEDFYNVNSEGIGEEQRALARHSIGYQNRDYLQDLAEDSITQFQIYQGFIREKGTKGAIVKVFDKLSRVVESSVELNEEWAFRIGQFGGIDQTTEIEFELAKNEFKINPQPIIAVSFDPPQDIADFYYRVRRSDFTISKIPFTSDLNPVEYTSKILKTAGYVRLDQVDFVIKNLNDILNININDIIDNDHIWITFDNTSWTVLRYNRLPSLVVLDAEKDQDQVTITINRRHNFSQDDIIGITGIRNLTGFFKISTTTEKQITVEVDSTVENPVLGSAVEMIISQFTPARFKDFDKLGTSSAALLKQGSKLWIDKNNQNRWEVVEKNNQYSAKQSAEFGVSDPSLAGYTVLYSPRLNQTISSIPGAGFVVSYVEGKTSLNLKQILPQPTGFESAITGSFGSSMALSNDSRWLIVGAPKASGVRSNYLGNYEDVLVDITLFNIFAGDVVLYGGRLWEAAKDLIPGVTVPFNDGSTIDFESQDWKPATINLANSSGRSAGFTDQGMITIYEFVQQQWVLRQSFISPRAADRELFGSKIAISQQDNEYYMAVSAPGSLGNKGRVYFYVFRDGAWQHDKHSKYVGIYNQTRSYNKGEIVWFNSTLWEAQDFIPTDDSSILVADQTQTSWLQLDPVSTQNSLPQNISLEDDGSTLALGLLSENQMAEIVKDGDKFGASLAMSATGNILAIGAPFSDGQYFPHYRGLWNPYQTYTTDDVVRYENLYFRLEDAEFSINENPTLTTNWLMVGDSSEQSVGKVFVYQRSTFGIYELVQTITANSLDEINDLEISNFVRTGDEFGHALAISESGNTLVITSPKSDINTQDQGAAFIFKTSNFESVEYRLKQKLESFEKIPNEYFGQSVCISPRENTIVIGARNTPFNIGSTFDSNATVFDQARTNFVDFRGFAGAVYVFERKTENYFLAEKLETQLSQFEAFGFSISCSDSVITVGSPYYSAPSQTNAQIVFDTSQTGITRIFKKDPNIRSWNVIATEEELVNIDKIQDIQLYDNVRNIKLQNIDYVDYPKLKILNIAEQEIKFKTLYDPAVYSIGTDTATQSIEPQLAWAEKHVGELWWDLSQAKWVYAEQGDIANRITNWNKLVEGASIDIYEWVETPLLPSEWAGIADTTEGISLGISGQPLYPNDDVYTRKQLFSAFTGEPTETRYFYWVRNKVVIPQGVTGRRISAADVRRLIENPIESNVPFIALIGKDKFLSYNFSLAIVSDTALLNILYRNSDVAPDPVHNEYLLLTEGVADAVPNKQLETKWIDSLIGVDPEGNRVPDTDLPEKQKYGLGFRPKQSMFVDRLPALRTTIENVNAILKLEPFADFINFSNLNSKDEIPPQILNLYDVAVDTRIDLDFVGTVRIRTAVLRPTILNGEIDTIEIVDTGFGYKTAPKVVIDGDGLNAEAAVTLDRDGRIIAVTVIRKGRKYSIATVTVRSFSVLITSDNTVNNFWSIYAWDDQRRIFFRSRTQSFDTARFWNLVDWWKQGYGPTSRIVKEITTIVDEPIISLEVGDLIRIKEFAQGGWAVFEKIAADKETFSETYQMIGRQDGTIEFSKALYDRQISGVGYDFVTAFDTDKYDRGIAKELRNILSAVKEDIFINEYKVEWNKLFFSSIRYAFVEQEYIDWAFKTSYLNAVHNIGSFEQKRNYKSDRLESFQEYINEVKPYRTTVREYVSKYDNIEDYNSSAIDFDLPAYFSRTQGMIVSVAQDDGILGVYPWRWWRDNLGYSIVEIIIADAGEDYQQPPQVIIQGNGIGATATAFVSSGRLSGIVITNGGNGFTTTPVITLVGGNLPGSKSAKAVAILGDSVARTFSLAMKFDRISKEGLFENLTQTDNFTATGVSSAFELTYPPEIDKTKVTIFKNDQLLLDSDFEVRVTTVQEDNGSRLVGKLTLRELPQTGDEISIEYEKNVELLDSVDRINKFYNPKQGMKGKAINQLMTGIDFGGVQVQGTTFDVTGGWDALPWFTDSWDSVEASNDFYVVVDGSTTEITLPFIPNLGQEITVYLKREGEEKAVRIDDPNFIDDQSSLPTVDVMPTFIGDGVNNIVEIGQYIQLGKNDTLIFRPIDSDGAVVIKDNNLLDTNLSGGTLASLNNAYTTATGVTAEEIVINGGKLIDPDQVPAPEENIPGQVLDSVSIKVFTTPLSATSPIYNKVQTGNGVQSIYDIGLNIVESASVIVTVDKIRRFEGNSSLDYSINFIDNNIEFVEAPQEGSVIEIVAIGIGGVSIIDYQEFLADGDTSLFLTNARFVDTQSIFVTVNGEYIDVAFINSTGVVETSERTLVTFAVTPQRNSVIKVVSLASKFDIDASQLIRVNNQIISYDGSSRSYTLDNFVNVENASAVSSMIVEVDNRVLKGADSIFTTYDGVNRSFVLGVDPFEAPGSILSSNIKVFVNNELKVFIRDYFYDGTTKVLTLEEAVLTKGDTILIVNDLRSEYLVAGSTITFTEFVNINEGDNISVTWFSQYETMRIISDEYTGGKVQYQLQATPLSIEYVNVYKNGEKLTPDIDFRVVLPRNVIYLYQDTTTDDNIKVVLFGSNIYQGSSAFELHKDMLNISYFKRHAISEVKLTKDLYYYDQEMVVTDASELAEPIKSRNVSGTVYINGERIQYLVKQGNVLSQLRRGVQGTAIAEKHNAESFVVDVGFKESIPYKEQQNRVELVSDGTSILIGPIEFVPKKVSRNIWFRESIPEEFGPCDEIEVFVAGRRLRKNPITVYDEPLGSTSPQADKILEAEFSVDGETPFIRLTDHVPAGVRITIIKRTGNIWYSAGENTASSGVTLLENDTPIARFIAQKSSLLPE